MISNHLRSFTTCGTIFPYSFLWLHGWLMKNHTAVMRSDTPLPESCKLFLQMGSLYFHVTLFWSAGLGTRFLWEFQCCAFKDGTQESEGELWWVWALMRNFCRALGLKDSLKRTGIATHPKWMWKAREPFLSVYTHNFKTDTSLRA